MLAGYLGIDVINAGRRWAYSRARLRLLLDSKTATPQAVQKAKVEYNKLSNEMEVMVGRLERMMQEEGIKAPPVKQSRPAVFPWQQVLGFIGDAAKAAEVAIKPQEVQARAGFAKPQKDGHADKDVIDTEGEST